MAKSKTYVLNQIENFLKDKDGYLLSEYENAQKKLIWKCSKNHIFEKNWNHVKRGQWCNKCSGRKLSINDIKELAKSRNGECLSINYNKCIDKLTWKCSSNHIWEASLNSIKNQNSWCPICNQSYGEKICRKYFECYFNKSFPKTRPNWLVNKDGYRLELDGYCSELNLAFEYNGLQHYSNIKFFNFNKQNDEIKRKLCKEKGITLIEIPENSKVNDKKEYIKKNIIKSLDKLGYKPGDLFLTYEVADKDIYDENKLSELKEIAKKYDGYLLSSVYGGIKDAVELKCKYNHIWKTTPQVIKNGSWCPECNGSAFFSNNTLVKIINEIKEKENNKIYIKALSQVLNILK